MRIALVGNPNSGKTTMFNALTGSNERIGNWAGVTVEKNEKKLKNSYNSVSSEDVFIVDLPGTYSLVPFTGEESIALTYIRDEKPDVIINIVDSTNLRRGLFLTTELLEQECPVIIALNKSDISKKKEVTINEEKLSSLLKSNVIKTDSSTNEGLLELINNAITLKGTKQESPFKLAYEESEEKRDQERFSLINTLVDDVEDRNKEPYRITLSDKLDKILTNRFLGIPIFALVMLFIFMVAVSESPIGLGRFLEAFLTDALIKFQGIVGDALVGTNEVIHTILVDGILGGVIAVVGFLPLIMVLYFFVALLEDMGYMARVSVIFDPIFKKVGLSGKSVIPFIIGVGCTVPGIMSTRTIRSRRERRATIMVTSFMPCGAKIPVIALFAGAFLDYSGLISTIMYFVGITLIFLSSYLVYKMTGAVNKKNYFLMELPSYKRPSISYALKQMVLRGKEYIIKASTIILLCNTVVKIIMTYGWDFKVASTPDESMLSTLVTPVAYIMYPLIGIVSWKLAASTITGFIAKENIVSTLALMYSLTEVSNHLLGSMGISKVAALAFLTFNLFSPPCVAALSSMRAELGSRRWFIGAVLFELGVGYVISFLIFFIGTLIVSPKDLEIIPTTIGLLIVAIFIIIISILIKRNKKEVV